MTRLDQKIDGYVIATAGGKYIGIDHSSGGYPYVPMDIVNIHVWSSAEKAQDYVNIFKRSSSFGDLGHATSWRVRHIVIMELDS